jgi:hypothetical protein
VVYLLLEYKIGLLTECKDTKCGSLLLRDEIRVTNWLLGHKILSIDC